MCCHPDEFRHAVMILQNCRLEVTKRLHLKFREILIIRLPYAYCYRGPPGVGTNLSIAICHWQQYIRSRLNRGKFDPCRSWIKIVDEFFPCDICTHELDRLSDIKRDIILIRLLSWSIVPPSVVMPAHVGTFSFGVGDAVHESYRQCRRMWKHGRVTGLLTEPIQIEQRSDMNQSSSESETLLKWSRRIYCLKELLRLHTMHETCHVTSLLRMTIDNRYNPAGTSFHLTLSSDSDWTSTPPSSLESYHSYNK